MGSSQPDDCDHKMGKIMHLSDFENSYDAIGNDDNDKDNECVVS